MKKIMHKRRLSLWAGVMLLVPVLYSGAARALPNGCQTGTTYTGDKGMDVVNVQTPVTITLNQNSPVNSVVYEAELPSTPYICYSSFKTNPAIQVGKRFITDFLPALDKASLSIQYVIPGVNGGNPFTPDGSTPYPIGEYDSHGFNSGTLGGKYQLFMKKKPDGPVNVVVPPVSDILNLVYGRLGSNFISFSTSTRTTVRLVPQCIGKVSVPAAVDLGRVITGGKGSLPSPRNFYINTSFNRECEGFSNIDKWGGFSLTLEIQFSDAGADAAEKSSSGKTGIILKNSDGQKNGLQLVIKEAGSTPVKFGEWSPVSPAITTSDLPLNLHYTASLEPVTPGGVTSAVTGAFSQDVAVKVRYQ
ncbi:TPA: fimbrial protein [Salmonella enterica subsp. enterica serovar Saintpaul]